jgi:hypothetical protein
VTTAKRCARDNESTATPWIRPPGQVNQSTELGADPNDYKLLAHD